MHVMLVVLSFAVILIPGKEYSQLGLTVVVWLACNSFFEAKEELIPLSLSRSVASVLSRCLRFAFFQAPVRTCRTLILVDYLWSLG